MLCVAGSTFWFYDYLITCGYEYTGIWPTRLTLVKVLYIIVSTKFDQKMLTLTTWIEPIHYCSLFRANDVP